MPSRLTLTAAGYKSQLAENAALPYGDRYLRPKCRLRTGVISIFVAFCIPVPGGSDAFE